MDLNADSGEGLGNWDLGDDEALLAHVSSASVACGFHAGDPVRMRDAIRRAKRLGVGLGAHPGYPDLLGFGRRELAARPDEIAAYCLYQVGALASLARAEGVELQHVKLHGALYARTARDTEAAVAFAAAVRTAHPHLVLVMPPSEGASAVLATGAEVALEGYVDLDYEDGFVQVENPIRPKDPVRVAERAVEVASGYVPGRPDRLPIETICLHGDGPNVLELVRAIRRRFDQEGIRVAPLTEVRAARTLTT